KYFWIIKSIAVPQIPLENPTPLVITPATIVSIIAAHIRPVVHDAKREHCLGQHFNLGKAQKTQPHIKITERIEDWLITACFRIDFSANERRRMTKTISAFKEIAKPLVPTLGQDLERRFSAYWLIGFVDEIYHSECRPNTRI